MGCPFGDANFNKGIIFRGNGINLELGSNLESSVKVAVAVRVDAWDFY